MATTYPYWDTDNRYIVAGPSGKKQTVFAQVFALPNSSFWRVRCFGSRSDCPEKLGPFFASQASAQSAIQSHCQIVHYVTSPGPPVGPFAPEIIGINPQSIKISTPFTLTVNGANFTSASKIYFDGVSQSGTVFTSAQQLSCPILATQIATARYYSVQVVDVSTGSSNTFSFAATATAASLAATRDASTDPTTPSKIVPRF